MIFIFRPCPTTVDLTSAHVMGRGSSTLSPSNDLHITPQIQLHQICGARRCSIINTPSGAVILTRPFLTFMAPGMYIMTLEPMTSSVGAIPYNFLFLALLSPALVATLAGLETASLELNAHLRVQPAHCVYDFYFSTMPYYRRPYKRARYGKRIKYSISLQ